MTAVHTGELGRSYRRCREINRRHGTTYYWSTRVLPRDKQPHVFAVYAFCRHADDIVDDLGSSATPEQRRAALAAFGDRFFADLARGRSDHQLLAATVHTVVRWGIEPSCFERFLGSMAADLDIAGYDTFDDLCGYMDGSAAVIGEMVLPVLEPTDPSAVGPARNLGLAFQLTNFLRDVGEDLDRGRVYLPREDLDRFGVDPWERKLTPQWRALMRFEIARTRLLYADADRGIALLPDRSARCITAARQLYSRILERIEAQDYDVFSTRAGLSGPTKAVVAARALMGRASVTGAPAVPPRPVPIGTRNP